MAENGLDLRTWLTVIGIFVMFFGFPVATIALDLRKEHRKQSEAPVEDATMNCGGAGTVTDESSRDRVPVPINTRQRNDHAAVSTEGSQSRHHREPS